jgi:predicted nuclease with TOPRIM domain
VTGGVPGYDGRLMDTPTQQRESEVAALQAELERLRAEHARFREEVDRELVRRAYRIGELEQALHQCSLDYQNSFSWRVTRPVRGAKQVLAGLRQR